MPRFEVAKQAKVGGDFNVIKDYEQPKGAEQDKKKYTYFYTKQELE